ncbi:hypothetical protein PSHT_07910 [Puccinia striiformis]|uniref:Uncharacterized protein n=1 Tax=Puccinia striiformis TaxID=27350 RepID=A0A2S4VTV2_9BASI|nr:hypothetical protein PSHT_07910 [Puccinia striiformis]
MNETNYNSDMGSNADDEHQMPPNSIIHFPTADSSDHDNNPLTSHCSESSDLMSDTDDTASKRGSDGHIPINIECGHPIQTRAPGHRFKLGVQAPGPLRLNWLAIHLVACCPSLNRMAAPGVDWDVTIQARFAGSDEVLTSKHSDYDGSDDKPFHHPLIMILILKSWTTQTSHFSPGTSV